MKKVLLIAYYFPPKKSVASIRLGGLAKYLRNFGWEPIILTTKTNEKINSESRIIETFYPGDVSSFIKKTLHLSPEKHLLDQAGLPVQLKQSKNPIFVRLIDIIGGILIYPDEEKKWFPYAVQAASKLINEEKIDAIISSSAPVTSHLIAKKLKGSFNIPWIADLRDLWSQTHLHSYGIIRRYREQRLELDTLTETDALTTVSEPLANTLRTVYKDHPIFIITNGFDPQEVTRKPVTKEFTITYTGKIYPLKQDPVPLFKAIRELIDEGIMNPTLTKIRFYGQTQHWIDNEIKEYSLKNIVKQYGEIPREEALDRQRESQILLLLTWNEIKNQGIYTAKIFEYLAAQRPIIAVGAKDIIQDLMSQTNAGTHASHLQELKNLLRGYYEEFLQQGFVSYKGDPKEINKYSHIEMARKFADILEKISK